MDPVEERDVEKLLIMLEDPRVIEKLASKLTWLACGVIVPASHVSENKGENENGVK